jgi:hypothetical protein
MRIVRSLVIAVNRLTVHLLCHNPEVAFVGPRFLRLSLINQRARKILLCSEFRQLSKSRTVELMPGSFRPALLVVETPGQQLMFNSRDVTLVDRDAVTFLADCEVKGIGLENCPQHIRNWIDREKRRNRRPSRKKI